MELLVKVMTEAHDRLVMDAYHQPVLLSPAGLSSLALLDRLRGGGRDLCPELQVRRLLLRKIDEGYLRLLTG